MKNNIKIICDGVSNMPRDLAEKYDIDVIPLIVRLDGVEYRDDNISNEDFFKLFRNTNGTIHTSQATYIDFKDVFEKYVNQGKTVIYISASSKATGVFQSATLAKNSIDNGEIHLFDSMNICFGCGLLVLEAARMNSEGASVEEILSRLEFLREKVLVTMSIGTLDYLRKSGRVSNSKALIGNVLNIKPMLTVKDGLIYQEAQVRGNKKVLPYMINKVKELCGTDFSDKVIGIGCGDNFEDRDALRDLVMKELNPKELLLLTINPVNCAHTGPNLIGLTCFR